MRARTVLAAAALFASAAAPAMIPSDASAQGCNSAYYADSYGNCVPASYYDLDCADINFGVYQLVDVNYDPYNLDTVGGPGNGWTCDGIG